MGRVERFVRGVESFLSDGGQLVGPAKRCCVHRSRKDAATQDAKPCMAEHESPPCHSPAACRRFRARASSDYSQLESNVRPAPLPAGPNDMSLERAKPQEPMKWLSSARRRLTDGPPLSPVSHSTSSWVLRSAGASCAPTDNPETRATQVLSWPDKGASAHKVSCLSLISPPPTGGDSTRSG